MGTFHFHFVAHRTLGMTQLSLFSFSQVIMAKRLRETTTTKTTTIVCGIVNCCAKFLSFVHFSNRIPLVLCIVHSFFLLLQINQFVISIVFVLSTVIDCFVCFFFLFRQIWRLIVNREASRQKVNRNTM